MVTDFEEKSILCLVVKLMFVATVYSLWRETFKNFLGEKYCNIAGTLLEIKLSSRLEL
jgi:hypothetical protein